MLSWNTLTQYTKFSMHCWSCCCKYTLKLPGGITKDYSKSYKEFQQCKHLFPWAFKSHIGHIAQGNNKPCSEEDITKKKGGAKI